jgi:polysaccharide export outer membrane protein
MAYISPIVRLFVLFLAIINAGCSLPGNYLVPNSMHAPYRVNGTWCHPNLIILNGDTITKPSVRALIGPSMHKKPYCVGAFDNLTIIVWDHPELSTGCTPPPQVLCNSITPRAQGGLAMPAILVGPEGSISYPLVGQISVAGLTTHQIEMKITRQLSHYIRNPHVSVQVAQFRNRSVYVLGEVKTPGQQPLTDKPLSLLDAITTAKIDPTQADAENIYLIRGDFNHPCIFWWCGKTPQSLLLAQHFLLEENDIVYVCAANMSGWNRFINDILPSLESYFLLRNLVP